MKQGNRSFILPLVVTLALLSPASAICQSGRVSRLTFDSSEIKKIFLTPGLVSTIEFPAQVMEVKLGNPADIKVTVGKVNPREITIILNGKTPFGSNMFVRCENKVFLFDVIPSSTQHQDYIQVSGRLRVESSNMKELSSSSRLGLSVKHNISKSKTLIGSSK